MNGKLMAKSSRIRKSVVTSDSGTLDGKPSGEDSGKVARKNTPLVGVIMGSDSDLKVMQAAIDCLKEFKIAHEVKIVSAHRTPQAMFEYAATAAERGLKVIVAGAGGAAHLPGMVAAITWLPVVGVPINATRLNGIDAILSVVQMPKGVPVATVAIDNAYNAALLALRILASGGDLTLIKKLLLFRDQQTTKVNLANKRLRSK
jgi:phosphoribosylaminoimidazole carboxylase PurE protein